MPGQDENLSDLNDSLIDATGMCIIVLDREGRVVRSNPATEETTGFSALHMTGRPMGDFFPDGPHREEFERALLTLREKGRGTEFTSEICTRRGDRREIAFSLRPVERGGGEVVFFVCTGLDITQRMRVEGELKQSEKLFRTVCTVVPAAIMIMRGDRMRFVNEAASAITGYSREEMLTMNFWDIARDDFQSLVRERGLARQRNEDIPRNYEIPIARKNGETRWVDYTGSSFMYEGCSAVLGVAFDITERKREEERLQRRIQLEHALGEISSRFIRESSGETAELVHDALSLIGNLLNVDRSFIYIFADTPGPARLSHCWVREGVLPFGPFMDELGPDGFPDCFDKLSHGEFIQIYDTGDSPYDREIFRERHDAIRAKSVIVIPIQYSSGKRGSFGLCSANREVQWDDYEVAILQVMGGIFISALAGAEGREALRLSEERYKALYDDNPSMYFTLSRLGAVLSVNRFGAGQLGYTPEEMRGMPASKLYHPDDRDQLRAGLKKAAAHPFDLHRWELRKIHKDRSIVWVRETVRVVTDQSGKRMFFVSCENITDARRALEERKKLEAQIEYAQRMESVALLASVIAHEFNNQLMVISTNAELALFDIPADSPAGESLTQIMKTVESSGSMTGQLLAYSGRNRSEKGDLNLTNIVREMDRLLSVAFSKRAVIEFDLANTIPAANGNGTQIRQILMNLMTNAVDALEGHMGVITVRTGEVHADRDELDRTVHGGEGIEPGEFAFLEVADTGKGIDSGDYERIFEPFHTSRKDGRGLGLFVVAEIVESFGGAIQVESDPERGSVFRILLPATGEAARADLPEREDEHRFDAWRGEGKVLIIDDNDDVRGVCARVLKRAGFTVLTAESGRTGIELFRREYASIAAVLLDLTMADVGGIEAYGVLKMIDPDATIILTSGYSREISSEQFEELKPAGFIQKPYYAIALIDLLREALADRAK